MSYTLKGRIESRLAAALVPLLVASGLVAWLSTWWPLELVAAMLAVGVALDVLAYHRLLPYQPGWAAVPMGLLELGIVMALIRAADVHAPLRAALALYAGAWLVAQLLGHAGYPLLRLSYGEDGGELGRAGAVAVAAVLVLGAGAGGVAWATQPPTVHLAAGVHDGPIVIDRTETLVGAPGAIVRGGIVVHADDVTIRDVTVEGGLDGITVDGATNVRLEGVRVRGARQDAIHVRRSQVMIRDCSISHPGGRFAQGIDISFAFDLPMSMVEGCTVRGGQEGIVGDWAQVEFRGNHVVGTTMRAITLNEMSMGMVEENRVDGALGVGIFCSDSSECEIRRNTISDTRPDHASGDLSRMGYAIEAHYHATATLEDNVVRRSPGGVGAFVDGHLRRSSQ